MIKATKKSEGYEYVLKNLVSVHDADSLTADVDLGFYATMRLQFRFYGINAPEITGTPEYKKTKLFALAQKAQVYVLNELNKAIAANHEVKVRVIKQEKFGRWLGIFMIGKRNLNNELLKKGFARFYMGDKPKEEVWANYKGV